MDIFPGITNIKASATIKRERLLPRSGEVIMRIGQQVSPVQVIARTVERPRYIVLNASRVLGVPPQDVPRYLLVEEGASLIKGMPVMRKPGAFGRGRVFNSPAEGILYHIYNGRLIVQLVSEPIEVRAMVRAHVNGIIAHRGVVLEINGSLIQAIWGSGKEGVGKIKLASRDERSELLPESLDKEARGAILVAGRVSSQEMLSALEQQGVKGLVVGSLSAAICAAAGDFSFPIILTDGIGAKGMTRPVFNLLRESEGREATLFGQVNAQAGERPEIIIPLPVDSNPVNPSLPGVKLEVGQMVRIIRAPYTGAIGRVTRLYVRAKNSAVGIRIPGADVTLPDGEVVFVPYTNLDLLA
ncbi:MAG: hypothetical protein KA314_03095 [Chloroflexi bacterium]|nr:hypothetical protein [Chloroflexota bacterium]MBP8054797.1 hypothetical protein [Chloroflexota bacterium]